MANDRLIRALDEYESAADSALKTRPYFDPPSILKVLTARDLVARELDSAESVFDGELARVLDIDGSLRRAGPDIAKALPPQTFSQWRASRQPETDYWWWNLDAEGVSRPALKAILVPVGWLIVALAVSVLVEDLRRLLAGASDGLSTAVQAVLAFVLGGTAIQYARQLVGSTKRNPAAAMRRGNYVAAVLLVAAAVVLEWKRPALAEWFSSMGAQYRNEAERSRALRDYQRGASLNPDSAFAHVNLAIAYEDMFDYDKAETEYLAAIRANRLLAPAYDRLGRLSILRRKDYRGATKLFEAGLAQTAQLNGQILDDWVVDKAQAAHWTYRLRVGRAWALYESGAYVAAEEDLGAAITLERWSAPAYCLRFLVEDKQERFEASAQDRNSCTDVYKIDPKKNETEPEWLALAREPSPAPKAGGRGRK